MKKYKHRISFTCSPLLCFLHYSNCLTLHTTRGLITDNKYLLDKLKRGLTLTIKVVITSSYLGSSALPAIRCISSLAWSPWRWWAGLHFALTTVRRLQLKSTTRYIEPFSSPSCRRCARGSKKLVKRCAPVTQSFTHDKLVPRDQCEFPIIPLAPAGKKARRRAKTGWMLLNFLNFR